MPKVGLFMYTVDGLTDDSSEGLAPHGVATMVQFIYELLLM